MVCLPLIIAHNSVLSVVISLSKVFRFPMYRGARGGGGGGGGACPCRLELFSI